MNKKVLAGSIIVLAAGIATFFYKRRNKLSSIASDSYDKVDDVLGDIEDKTEHSFS